MVIVSKKIWSFLGSEDMARNSKNDYSIGKEGDAPFQTRRQNPAAFLVRCGWFVHTVFSGKKHIFSTGPLS